MEQDQQDSTPPVERMSTETGQHEDNGAAGPTGPLTERERIAALDVLRGFAIFGIFMVNIAFFSMPLFEAMETKLLADEPLLDQAAWLLVKALFEVKFITLFSLLFGIGLIVQMKRIESRDGNFTAIYVRRLIALGVIGLVHGLLIWYGDILFMYAVAGVILLLCRSWSPRAMLTAGTIAFLGGGLFYVAGIGLGAAQEAMKAERIEARAAEAAAAQDSDESQQDVHEQPDPETTTQPDTEPAAQADAAQDDRWDRFQAAMRDSRWNPEHPRWNDAETIAYKEGPFLAAFIMRAFAYAAHILFAGVLFGFWLRIIAVFLFGAALMKMNFFAPENHRWHWTFFIVGFLFGLPLEVAAALSYPASAWALGLTSWLGESVHYFSSMALTLGYVGAICLIVHAGVAAAITGALAAVGRMALTNYLGQSVIATAIMYWWGLGLFGDFSRAQQLGLVVIIFLGQIVFSIIWLRMFRFGPMEWLWRWVTYGRRPPLRG